MSIRSLNSKLNLSLKTLVTKDLLNQGLLLMLTLEFKILVNLTSLILFVSCLLA